MITLEEALTASRDIEAKLAAGGLEARERYNDLRDKAKRKRNLKSQSLMDSKFCEADFVSCNINKYNERPFRLCKRYAEHFSEMQAKNQGLLLYGNVGTGKTFMAACIANYLLEQSVSVIMTSFVKVLQGCYESAVDEESTLRNLNRARLLILDDLGAERSTDFALEKVYNIVDSRYRAKKPMVLTTNLSLEQMQAATDVRYIRIYDRIFEVCYPIEFRGKSWRKAEAASRFDYMTSFLEGNNGG